MTTHTAVSRNPATGEWIAEYPYESEDQLLVRLATAQRGYRTWSDSTKEERVALLLRVASALRADANNLALIACREMGKPIAQARAEVEKCALLCEWYAEHGPRFLSDDDTSIGKQAYVSYLPLGQVLAVMPWNFPLWQVMRGAVPILLAGNAYVLKHAPNVMGCAYALERIWLQAGLPRGAFTAINVKPDLVAGAIRDPRIAAVTLTGSVRAGSAVAALAGAALKKTVLELGGSDPFIVLADADVDAAVEAAVSSRFQNAGQVCIAAKRIILEEPVAKAFTSKFVAAVEALKVGDPEAGDTYVGPMARDDLREELDNQVQQTITEGATLLTGGRKLDGPGSFYAPTVLEVQPGMTAFAQETFGPVAALTVARDAEHAITLANDSEFGLSGAIWTADRDQAKAFARRMETGGVFVNGYSASDPRVPIGGVKKSGYGRELSHFGVREFMNAQTVWIDRK